MPLNEFKDLQLRDKKKRDILQRREITLIDIPYFAERETLSSKVTKIKNILMSLGVFFIDIPNEDIEKFIGKSFLKNKYKEELDLLLSKKNMTLISGLPVTTYAPLDVVCNKCGKKWTTSLKYLRRGDCRSCSYKKYYFSLEELEALAQKYNGHCLSKKELCKTNQCFWKCSNPNHAPWKSSVKSVTEGHWCRKCADENNKKYSIEFLNKFVKEKYNGRCLSTECPNATTKLEWKCDNPDHPSWFTTAFAVAKTGSWCPKCAVDKNKVKLRKYSIGDFQKFAKEKHHGQCLSTEFKSVNSPLEWKCNNPDHPSWFALPTNILIGRWCPKCAIEKRKLSLEDCQKFAIEKHHGQCLSTGYVNATTKMEWKCNNPDHPSWFATANSVMNNGTWCRQCVYEKQKKTKSPSL